MPTLEILEAEMFWAQYDWPPPATDDGGRFPAASSGAFDAAVHEDIFLLNCGGALPSRGGGVAPPRCVGAPPFARWSRYFLRFQRPRRRAPGTSCRFR